MTTFRSDDILVGTIGLALLPMIALRIVRGLREGRLPVYRTYFSRDEGRAKFNALLSLHALSFLVVAAISADLLLNLGFRDRI